MLDALTLLDGTPMPAKDQRERINAKVAALATYRALVDARARLEDIRSSLADAEDFSAVSFWHGQLLAALEEVSTLERSLV